MTKYFYELTEQEYKALLNLAEAAREMDTANNSFDPIYVHNAAMDLHDSLDNLQEVFTSRELGRFDD